MKNQTKSVPSMIASVLAGILYPLFLIVSNVFVVLIMMIPMALAGRSAVDLDRRTGLIHRTRWFITIDVIVTLVTYLAADILRTVFYMDRRWPEVEPNYGSTLHVHLAMMGSLAVAWPAILHWLGWYKARARSRKWRIRNTGAAAALLALFIATFALIFYRDIYPRAQIGFCIVLLPIVTGCVRIFVEAIERAVRRKRGPVRGGEPVW